MRKIERQTDFTIEEILELLDSKDQYYPSSMLLNEIGMIHCLEKDNDSEKVLICYLSDTDPDHRIISYCYIYSDKLMFAKYHSLLVDFRLKQENQELLGEIDEAIIHNERMRTSPSFGWGVK